MITDSKPAFEERVREFGLEAALPAFRTHHWDSFGALAFASSYVPGVGDDAVFVRDVVTSILGRHEHPSRHILRRPYYEAYTLAAADLKARQERCGDDAAPRQLPLAERQWAMAERDPTSTLTDRTLSSGEGMRIADFCLLPEAMTAKLETAHLAALRIYTTAAFKMVNGPLRLAWGARPHPFPVTVSFLSDAIGKLSYLLTYLLSYLLTYLAI